MSTKMSKSQYVESDISELPVVNQVKLTTYDDIDAIDIYLVDEDSIEELTLDHSVLDNLVPDGFEIVEILYSCRILTIAESEEVEEL